MVDLIEKDKIGQVAIYSLQKFHYLYMNEFVSKEEMVVYIKKCISFAKVVKDREDSSYINNLGMYLYFYYLNENDVQLNSGDYSLILQDLPKNSFVYLDPPYHPLTESSNFTGYVQGGWNEADQIRLRETCDMLTKNKIKFLLSNSCTPFIKEQ